MLSSPHDDHYQRTIRADLSARSSASSDTPSVYSRAFFSPMHNAPVSPFIDSRHTSPSTSMSGRQSNFDRLNDPAVSMLDLDEDQRSSIASSAYYGDAHQSARNEDYESLPQMSLLGPKMRFHSRAPWEMAEDALREEDESDFGTFLSTAKRGFGFSSPRTSSNSRPSGESAHSQVNSHKSFETTPSQRSYNTNAQYTFPQGDVSASLDRQVPRGNVPLSRESPDVSGPSSPSLFVSDAHSPSHPRFPDTSSSPEHGRIPRSPYPSTSRRRRSSSDETHPYANPDLVSHTHDQQHDQDVLRAGDSTATVTSTAASTVSKLKAKHARVPDTSISSVIPKNKASSLLGKEISSPITVLKPGPRPSHTNEDTQSSPSQKNVMSFPGWADRGAPPTFGLISLEEARAQRSRSITADSATSRPSTSIHVPSSAIAFPNTMHEHVSIIIDQSEYGHDAVETRTRSISAGSKAKNAFHTIIGGQPRSDKQAHESGVPTNNGGLPGRTLRHKKSGFMRLFNGARQDKEEKVQPPPVPSLSDAHATFNVQQVEQKISRTTTHRIPVPELAVPETAKRKVPQYEHLTPFEDEMDSRPLPSSKRPLPPLSIDTWTQSPSSREVTSSTEDLSYQERTIPPPGGSGLLQNKLIPQTAPAHVSEFSALKLRPISTMFSAQFGDHIIKDPRPSLDTDLGTPDSSGNILSPITPNSSARFEFSSGEKPTSDEQPSIIHSLQDKSVTAKTTWQRHIWELEGQVRDLKAELEELRASSGDANYCQACGRGKRQETSAGHRPSGNIQEIKSSSVVNRPRARTGTSFRFASAVS